MRRISPHLAKASHGKYFKAKNKKFVVEHRCKLIAKNTDTDVHYKEKQIIPILFFWHMHDNPLAGFMILINLMTNNKFISIKL
jgi:hypothetical protein